MSKISGQLLISGQFQDSEISGISRQLGALIDDITEHKLSLDNSV